MSSPEPRESAGESTDRAGIAGRAGAEDGERGSARQRVAARVMAVVLLAGAGVWAWTSMRTPSVTATDALRLIEAGELEGIPLGMAGEKLRQRLPAMETGEVVVRLENPGRAPAALVLEVEDGVVRKARLDRRAVEPPR